MARKRKKLNHLDYNTQEYWNRLLAQEGLSMSQGKHPKLIPLDPETLELVEKYAALGGRKLPHRAAE